ncbi:MULTISPECIES: XRE family transcriptional regulator [unclassified Facklamia]|uniref:helix-turn-helix domain-containing protein n=1 Tax=Aerococcaceae TaxID=186827 RepID=UPI0019679C5C|nr:MULTISPECIES: XRE family transcriptional regulator [unclassified Facklamia]
MNILGSVIREIRKSKRMTQADLAKKTGFKQNTISNHENGNRSLDELDIAKYAEALDLTPQALFDYGTKSPTSTLTLINDTASQLNEDRQVNVLEYAEDQLEEQNKIIHLDEIRELYADYQTQYEDVDLYGGASAGTGVELFDEVIETIKYPAPVPVHDIALKVLGDSMTPLFQDGEVIFIKKKQDINNGQIGVFIVNGQGYVKKLYKGPNEVKLISLNSHYKDIVLTEHDDIHIVGLVVM